jgi:D-amino-acid dehydrogenase
MKIIVIGSGLIGVTTAYFLSQHGHQVKVVDREEGPGRETSLANGALLTPSMAEPWNAPGSWRVLLASLCRSDAALQLRLRALPGLACWGAEFLRNSKAEIFERNALSNVRLALHSLGVMKSLRQQTNIQYNRMSSGSLRIFRDHAALDRACAATNRRRIEGLSIRSLSTREALVLEPALAPIEKQVVGALHCETDEVGDAHRFCVALADYVQSQGVEFRFRTAISSLELRAGRVVALLSQQERFVADRYIVAAGSYSTQLLRQIGVHLPVRPAKGYSVTFDRIPSRQALRVPIIDDQVHAVVVPLGEGIRVAGTAEFVGYDLTISKDRIQNLLTLLKDVLPQAQLDLATARPWCGLRAMSPDGVPIIGTTTIPNVLINAGHGHLGWTMAAGSAQLLADLLSKRATSVDPAPYAFSRFAAS